MILQALTSYYEALVQQGKLSAPGWNDAFKVSFWLEVGEDGQLLDVVDCRESVVQKKKMVQVPRVMRVPAHETRSSGIVPNFLCDNASYMIGADDKGKPERAKQCFQAAADLHHKLLDGGDTPAAKAVLAFFDSWNPETASEHPFLKERWKDIVSNANLVFAYDYPQGRRPVTEDPVFQEVWQEYYQNQGADAPIAQCLITGKQAPLKRTHPFIKGVVGTKTSGAKLVSFDKPAYTSYGHEQGANAPASEYAAFAYTTALNTLLNDGAHRRQIGKTTVVCWAENARTAVADLGMAALMGTVETTGLQEGDVSTALKQLAQGKSCQWAEKCLGPDQHLYFLGLAPNAARLSVRFFLRDDLQSFSRHIQAHQEALEIVHSSKDKRTLLFIWHLKKALIRKRDIVQGNELAKKAVSKQGDDEEKEKTGIPPMLEEDLLKAILMGSRYPISLPSIVLLRIRSEKGNPRVTRERAAILKAYYTRNEPHHPIQEVLTVELNEQSNYLPYVLGRIFAVLEKIQDEASDDINTTITDRYFSAACSSPKTVFPTLFKLVQKHLRKLPDKARVYFDKQLTELMCRVGQEFPSRLTRAEQGAFVIGYYHQTHKNYEKKTKED